MIRSSHEAEWPHPLRRFARNATVGTPEAGARNVARRNNPGLRRHI